MTRHSFLQWLAIVLTKPRFHLCSDMVWRKELLMLDHVVDALITATEKEPAFWPDLGVFSRQSRRNMPGLPGHCRLQFRPSAHLFRLVNDGDEAPVADEGSAEWSPDQKLVQRTADVVGDELCRAGEVTVPNLGTFGVQTRKTSVDDYQYWVDFRAAPDLIRKLNPKDKNYEAALMLDWPAGPPESDPGEAK
jgi:hypothetical protein